MKSPDELCRRWSRQWKVAETRERRLLSPDAWPTSLQIRRPTPAEFTHQTHAVRDHVQRWRNVAVGRVVWERVMFRSGSAPVEVPVEWILHTPSEWVTVCDDAEIHDDFQRLERLVSAAEPSFHRLIIRILPLLRERSEADILKAIDVASSLSPGCAAGRPLRALPVCGIDSKFFERHRGLLIGLLDNRFDGEVSALGLEVFLGAADVGEHWLLLAPLSRNLMPFQQQRIRAAELMITPLAVDNILIVENERCLYQIDTAPETIAILGAGLNLDWMKGEWLQQKRIGYWGDMDTWGLVMLSRARQHQSHVDSILMNRALFDGVRAELAVVEGTHAGASAPSHLLADEADFYRYLLGLEMGRVEQEFLPRELVCSSIARWLGAEGQ